MPTTANTTARATKPKLPSADYGALLALEFEPSLELGLATFDRDPDTSAGFTSFLLPIGLWEKGEANSRCAE
jgi:hypothetical protein